VRRELLRVVLAVALVDGLCIAGDYGFQLERAPSPLKIGYTAAWTAGVLLIVRRGLLRIRARRRRDGRHAGIPKGVVAP
jgi:hypothetical protein